MTKIMEFSSHKPKIEAHRNPKFTNLVSFQLRDLNFGGRNPMKTFEVQLISKQRWEEFGI